MLIEATGLACRAGDKLVLGEVTLSCRPGEMVGLIGPNGAGKTTLLRHLAGLAAPAAGRVTYDGQSLREMSRPALARRLAYLAQDADAHWPIRVDQLVRLGRLPHRRPLSGETAADLAAVAAALAATETTVLAARRFDTLSGGERMRALLARALAVEGEMLLADEPVAALDPYHQLHTMELLRSVTEKGAGVVVVLHDLTLAARFCDRLVLLAGGRVLADGPAGAVLSDRNIAEAYHIKALHGAAEGLCFTLPWRRLPPGDGRDFS
ncbi:ABC transporter ATP-binding protein [Zavarzinia compransoris]|uniref:ABC transporter n=1 Tax=Zavarzinia compransoris TaxID=1264899 RepID=A0A317DY30_9PROT|nr:ABC transporter ATP-binding protein [Zavarzinia compransoris]PWR19628.1 ABC transporter [Zavarzinia compransoris]TDP40386.1 iron complex transport system ATP-binding protein [Zavarzinia compransoris]